ETSLIFNVVFVVLVALFFGRVQHRVEYLVDRAFSGTSRDSRSALADVGSTLGDLLDVDEIVRQLGVTLHDCFSPRRLAVLLWSDGDARLWRLDPRSGQLEARAAVVSNAMRQYLAKTPGRPWRIGFEVAAESDAARREAVACEANAVVAIM